MVCKEEEKKLSDTEDLLEDLGRATDKVLEQQRIFIMLGANNFFFFCNHIKDRKRRAKVGLFNLFKDFHCGEFCDVFSLNCFFVPGTEGLPQGG